MFPAPFSSVTVTMNAYHQHILVNIIIRLLESDLGTLDVKNPPIKFKISINCFACNSPLGLMSEVTLIILDSLTL